MKRTKYWVLVALFGIVVGLVNGFGQTSSPTNDDFSAVSQAVVKLLETGDAPAFAGVLSPTSGDWLAAGSTNQAAQKSIDSLRAGLELSARELLGRARELKADFSKVHLAAEAKPARRGLTIRYDQSRDLPYAEELNVTVSATPAAGDTAASRLAGTYELRLRRVIRFQGGWRCLDGIIWTALPPGVADETVQRELTILARASAYKGITQLEDLALGKLAETLGRFIRERDLRIFEDEALMSFDSFRANLEKQLARHGDKIPPRAEVEQDWREHKADVLKPARAVLAVLD